MAHTFKPMRTKWNLIDDPDFRDELIDPRRVLFITLGGSAANGNYSIRATSAGVDETPTAVRSAAETLEDMADELADAINTDLSGLAEATYLDGTGTFAEPIVMVVLTTAGKDLIFSAPSAPANVTINVEGNAFKGNPITVEMSAARPAAFGNQGRVAISIAGIDADGDIVAPDITADIELIDVVSLGDRHPLVNYSVLVEEQRGGAPLTAELAGSDGFGVRLTNIANAGSAVGVLICFKAAVT